MEGHNRAFHARSDVDGFMMKAYNVSSMVE